MKNSSFDHELHVPNPTLRSVAPLLPFPSFQYQKMGPGRVFYDGVVVKATFDLRAGELTLARRQTPIALADRYHSTPAERSSVAEPGDLHLAKPGGDIVITGTARTFRGKPVPRWLCAISVERGSSSILEHRVVATGPRAFVRRQMLGWHITEPEPVAAVAVRYELAFGGALRQEDGPDVVFRPNPAGIGFYSTRTLAEAESLPAPQWELEGDSVEAPNEPKKLAGLGPVARMWECRLKFAGTYGPEWKERLLGDLRRGLVPDYAQDFDRRFFHVAHPGLQLSEAFRGDETFVLRGLVEDAAELRFRLPPLRLRAETLWPSTTARTLELAHDLIHVDLDAKVVHAVYRLELNPPEGIEALMLTCEGLTDAQAHR